MQNDPQYRTLMEKHGYPTDEPVVEMISEVQREEMMGHVRNALYHVSSKRQQRKVIQNTDWIEP